MQIKDGYLTISGKRELASETSDRTSGRRVRQAERQSGKFYRKIQLPADADRDSSGICAKVSDGVLEVTVFKLPATSLKQGEVDVNF